MRLGLLCKEALFRDALTSLLDHHGSYQVVTTADTARSLINSSKDGQIHVLVIDSSNLDPSELQFIMGARAFGDFAIVLIAQDEDKDNFTDLPVDKVVTRNTKAIGLFDALSELGSKIKITRPYVREKRTGYGDGNSLSRREYEVAQLVAKGMSNRKIAQVTGLREQSVKNLVSVIMRKLRCENRVQVALRLTQGAAGVVEGQE